MALAVANRSSQQITGGGTPAGTYTFTSISPAANAWLIVTVASDFAAGTPNQPTLMLGALSVTTVVSKLGTIGNGVHRRLTMFHAWTGASPGSISPVADFAGQDQDHALYGADEMTGGSTSSPIVQNATGSSSSATITVTLAAFSDAANCPYFVTQHGGTFLSNEAGYTQLYDIGAVRSHCIWNSTTADLTPSITLTAGAESKSIGVELNSVATAGGAVVGDPFGMSGFFGG